MKRPLLSLIGAGLVLGMLVGCSAPMPPGAGAAEPTAVVPTPAPSNTIIADAVVEPARSVDVAFSAAGTVAEVLVGEGDQVAAGAPLARLDTGALELLVAQSQANLNRAQATYDKLAAGATEAEIAAQQSLVRSAQAQLERSRTGNVTAADIAGARAQLRSAQARLDALRNPAPADISAAQLAVTAASTTLESVRNSASATKTNAELAMRQAADDLTKAQAAYATAKANWDYVQETGLNPANPSTVDPTTGQQKDNKLNDVQQRQYAETFVQAEATMRSAEKALSRAEVSYDQARQDEVTQIQRAEATLANAQQQLDALRNPSPSALAQAQASVDQARANLQKVQQGGTRADIAAAQAGVDQANSNLQRLTTPPRVVDLAEAQAGIEAAQVALKQAEWNLRQATLLAPFAGTIAERHLEVGQQIGGAGAGSPPFVLADFNRWKITTGNLNERDVVRIQTGSPAQITFDALPDLTLTGKVTAIQPRGADRFGDMIYTVTISPDSWDPRLRWNMSASVAIRVAGE